MSSGLDAKLILSLRTVERQSTSGEHFASLVRPLTRVVDTISIETPFWLLDCPDTSLKWQFGKNLISYACSS